MKIVHWGKYYHPDVGGIESVTRSLALGAAAAGHQVSVVCFGRGPSLQRRSMDAQVEVFRAPIRFVASSQPLGIGYWMMLMRSVGDADIVQAHAPNMLAALATLFLPRRVRLIVHWHSDVVGKGRLAEWLKPVERMMLERANCIVATSQRYAEASLALRPYLAKVNVVPIGVPDRETINSESGSDLPGEVEAWLDGSPFILAVGRLVPYKGFSVLIEAAKYVSSAKVVIVGRGPLEADLKHRIAAAGLVDKVLITGYLPGTALKALFDRAQLYCLPSVERSEAFGVVLPEAMSYGLPLVATNIPGSGVPWVNQHNVSGFNVPPGDAMALAEACESILSCDRLMAQLSSGARRRFEEEFEEKNATRRMTVLYRDLMSGAYGEV